MIRESVLRAIDRDRIEQHNVSTQFYGEGDVGAWKVEVLRGQLFRAYMYGVRYCSQGCATAGLRRECDCEHPAPNGEGSCIKCAREIPRVAALAFSSSSPL